MVENDYASEQKMIIRPRRRGRTRTLTVPNGVPTTPLGLQLATLIRGAREGLGISQTEAAGRAGLCMTDWHYLEAGHEPKLGRLLAVCRGLGVRVGDMIALLDGKK